MSAETMVDTTALEVVGAKDDVLGERNKDKGMEAGPEEDTV